MSEQRSEPDGSEHAGRSAFDRRNPLNWLIVGGILLIASIVIGTAVTVMSFRQRALENSGRELENMVLLLARHFDRELQNFEAVQRDLVRRMENSGITSPDEFRRRLSTEDFHKNLEALIGSQPDSAGINVFDAKGQLINSSRSWPAPALNISDRSFFREFVADKWSPTVLLAPVNSRFTGGWTTVIARKVTGPNGELLGVVGRGVSPANLESFFESLEFGQGAAISLLHRDGTLLARYPHVEHMIGKNLETDPVKELLSRADHGTARLISPVDGEERLASARALSEFPLAIIATTTVATALTDWRTQTGFLVAAAGLAALVIAFTLLVIVRKLSKQHADSEERLALEKERLATAINNMTQGLLLYDSDARMVLCNKSYLEMYNLPPDIVKPGCHFRDIVAYRKKTGTFRGDVDEYCSSVLRTVLHERMAHKVVQPAGERSVEIVYTPLINGGWVATLEDITERKRANERIAHMAHYDALTDLPNRALFHEQLEDELKCARRGEKLAVLYIDIDEFKSVNDSLGHPVGDELLRAVASRLRRCVRQTDIVARLGGDEFAIVLTPLDGPTEVTNLVERIYQEIREPYDCLGHQVTTDASIGIALAPQDASDLDQILRCADLAMYEAKAGGRRTYRFFEQDMDLRIRARRSMEMDLRRAIADGGLELHYQPYIDLRTDKISGCEALLRWNHPELGMISPAEFIPVAEDTGLINELGAWVLTAACAEAATWPESVKLAVNVSPVQFKESLALKVVGALAASGLSARRLELEITEAVLIRDHAAALSVLHQLRDIGVRIALDDFGTGYSSLSYLQRFPFDKIKIDRCFIGDIAEAGGSSSIVQAVIHIAEARTMTTTAEGVETQRQKEILQALGCTEMQGFLFSRALSAAELRTTLSQRDLVAA
jgi:diguanylate cyclase (GGDEF)-like protein